MSTETVSAADTKSASCAALQPSGRESLAGLLAAACAALDSDLDAAKACVTRAVALLKGQQDLDSPLQPATERGGLAVWQAQRVAAYVDANLDSTIRADDLAAVARLSTSYFFRAFRDTFGETPSAYVARRRMLRAQQLMLSSDEPLAQVALACGLCDQAHFTRMFRRVFGTTPHSWRRRFAAAPTGDATAERRASALRI